MSIIAEEDAKKYSDLYNAEIWVIDLLTGVKRLREQSEIEACGNPNEVRFDFWRSAALDAAQNLQVFLPKLIEELEQKA